MSNNLLFWKNAIDYLESEHSLTVMMCGCCSGYGDWRVYEEKTFNKSSPKNFHMNHRNSVVALQMRSIQRIFRSVKNTQQISWRKTQRCRKYDQFKFHIKWDKYNKNIDISRHFPLHHSLECTKLNTNATIRSTFHVVLANKFIFEMLTITKGYFPGILTIMSIVTVALQ